MILEIPILYRARVVPARHRNPATFGVYGHRVLLRVDEVDERDAPLAATMQDEGHRGGTREEYRQCGDGLVRRHLIPGPGKSWMPIRPETAQAELARWNHFRSDKPSLFHRRPDTYSISGWMQHGIPVRSTEWSKLQEVEAEVRAALAGAVFIGGDLHLRSQGPCWSLGLSDNKADLGVLAEFTADRGVWRGDRYADALEAGQAASAAQSARLMRTDPGPVVRGELDVLRPEAFTVDDDWEVLKVGAAQIVVNSRREMPDWNRPEIEAWLDLRDAVAAWPERACEATLATVTRLRARMGARFDAMLGSYLVRHASDRLEIRGYGLAAPEDEAAAPRRPFGH